MAKRIFLDMKFFDIGATVEAAVRGIAQYDLDFLTVHGDPHVVAAAKQGAAGSNLKILAVTILTSLDRDDLIGRCTNPATSKIWLSNGRVAFDGRCRWGHRVAARIRFDPCAA